MWLWAWLWFIGRWWGTPLLLPQDHVCELITTYKLWKYFHCKLLFSRTILSVITAIYGSFEWGGLHKVGGEPNYAYGSTIPLAAHMNFQMMFAVITPALISGGVVERIKFSSYLIFVIIWTTIVYDTLAHWMWSSWVVHNSDDTCSLKSGWLKELGALDFAGTCSACSECRLIVLQGGR